MKNILIVGNGGREYAVTQKLSQTKQEIRLYYVGSDENLGISRLAHFLGRVSLSQPDKIVEIAVLNHIDMAFIGPEAYLNAGIVNLFAQVGVPCIGPIQELAKIETSKVWARELIEKAHLGAYNPEIYGVLDKDSSEDQIALMLSRDEFVVKPDGLHSGRGVKLFPVDFTSIKEARDYINSVLKTGERVLIEEKLTGREFSFMSFTDGINCAHTIPVQDYKRAYEGDNGPNTGSMGSVTGPNNKLNFLTDEDLETCSQINEKVVSYLTKYVALSAEMTLMYTGVLYGSYIKTSSGIKIIEFNARFGDPECINVLHLLETDLYDIFVAIINGTLDQIKLKFRPEASVLKYKVPVGYPDVPKRGQPIEIWDAHYPNLIYAGLTVENNQLVTTGSRTIGLIESAPTVAQAARKVNFYLDKIEGKLFYRKDIGLEMDYRTAGVNIEEGNKVVRSIRPLVEATFNEHVVSEFGDFSGMMKLGNGVVVASTDGVGTKSILVLETYGPTIGYEMLGRDLVNHCVNDTLVKGAKPLFFLDYFASSKLEAQHTISFVKGISEACQEVGCVLLGGETAEMPDVYKEGASDVVGMMVGVVKEKDIIHGKEKIKKGDIILGLPSSGPHTNGYTLIRRILSTMDSQEYHHMLPYLCATHKCYFNDVHKIKKSGVDIHGLCHITGGGFIDNPPRILPEGLTIDWKYWPFSPVFRFLQEKGGLSDNEMRHVFNCGVGMLVFIDPKDLEIFPDLEQRVVGTVV